MLLRRILEYCSNKVKETQTIKMIMKNKKKMKWFSFSYDYTYICNPYLKKC